ncbi:hypothetical protein C7T94_16160 [Pedobacter yulinensis]|uniref:Uncharacterized protein n=2 Tax=Pedobacter yulinensis TaxID=2126353 RepID=A0A2T3HIP5_9SPHI|nr:hypothetical protein C7T94_16160 [Pedobacter yulinensis]
MNIKLGIAANGENFQPVYTIQDSDFASGQMSTSKEFTATIANTKLVHQKRIALYYSLPNSGPEFFSEYLSYNYFINNAPPVNSDHLKIQSMGFSTVGISDGGNYYLVEDDIMLSKSYVSNYVPGTPAPIVAFDNINIIIDQSIWANPLWNNALSTAVSAWNLEPNMNVKLHIIASTSGNSNIALPPPSERHITVVQSSTPQSVPVLARFPINDGRPGQEIYFNPNFKYASTGQGVTQAQAAWNLVHAIGHSLGFSHASGTGAETSIMLKGTSSSAFNDIGFSTYDSQTLSAKYPISTQSTVAPFISGKISLLPFETTSFETSYYAVGLSYAWKAVGVNGTSFNMDYDYVTGARLPEVDFPAGSYEIQCFITGSKFNGQIVARRTIIVQ